MLRMILLLLLQLAFSGCRTEPPHLNEAAERSDYCWIRLLYVCSTLDRLVEHKIELPPNIEPHYCRTNDWYCNVTRQPFEYVRYRDTEHYVVIDATPHEESYYVVMNYGRKIRVPLSAFNKFRNDLG